MAFRLARISCHGEIPDAVDAVDGGEEVVRVFKAAPVFQKSRQVEIVFREHDFHGLHPAVDAPRLLRPLVFQLKHPMFPHGLTIFCGMRLTVTVSAL